MLTIANRYIYDHVGRKLKTWEQITNGTTQTTRTLLSQVVFNEAGQVWYKQLHSTDSLNFLQTVAYTYNERGWLLQSTAPLFEEQLQYNQVAGIAGISPVAQYNGNIASQSWGTSTALNGSSFVYSYDALNRLTQGRSADNKFIERGISYDLMGNINTLSRVYNSTLIDSMTYAYNSTNQLQSVYDKSPDAGVLGYKTGNWTYAYDGNGNMITDNSKGINKITYNLLNLPQSIAALNTTYTYDAGGQKLRRVIGTATTDYIDGIEYDSGALSFIQTEEGRALPNGTTLYNYEYSLSDHLGDERITFDSHTTTPTIVQQDNYMPFGMDISAGPIVNPQNNYLYNKKELQGELAEYDYGARFYDPVIARWNTVDLLAEKYRRYSPYDYAFDSPIRFIDLNGEGPGDRVKFALRLTHAPYHQEKGMFLRTSHTQKGMQKMDCSELVCRVMAADGITNGVQSMATADLLPFLNNKRKFIRSETPKVGDIALWNGHTGIVGEVDENNNIKLIHERGENKPGGENPKFASTAKYHDDFEGYYRPIVETPDGKPDNTGDSGDNNSEQQEPPTGDQRAMVEDELSDWSANYFSILNKILERMKDQSAKNQKLIDDLKKMNVPPNNPPPNPNPDPNHQ